MLCRPKKGKKTDKSQRKLRAFTIFNVVDSLEELKEKGYYFSQEQECLGGEVGIQMVFEHFLSGNRKYLYVQKEEVVYGEEIVMWISDHMGELDSNEQTDEWIRDELSVLENALQEIELIPKQGIFQKISLKALPEQSKESLFAVLYRLGLRQLREGWGKVKEDHFDEQSVAWAGEFTNSQNFVWGCKYLYLVIIKRDFEERESLYDSEFVCVWKDTILDVYMARSNEPMDLVCPEGESPIQLREIAGIREITKYLDAFEKIDCMLKKG